MVVTNLNSHLPTNQARSPIPAVPILYLPLQIIRSETHRKQLLPPQNQPLPPTLSEIHILKKKTHTSSSVFTTYVPVLSYI